MSAPVEGAKVGVALTFTEEQIREIPRCDLRRLLDPKCERPAAWIVRLEHQCSHRFVVLSCEAHKSALGARELWLCPECDFVGALAGVTAEPL